MHMLIVGLLAGAAWSDAAGVEPSEGAMREAFASELSDGVNSALTFVAETEGAAGLARIRAARTDEFEIVAFRKGKCHPSVGDPGHVCRFLVEVGTVAGPILRSVSGRFHAGPCGLVFEWPSGDAEG